MEQGRHKVSLELTEAERRELVGLIRRHKNASPIALRARIVLLCADGMSNAAVARKLGTTSQRVGRWRRRFVERRLDGLWDEPRSGTPRKITDAQVEEVVRLTLESSPSSGANWSTRSMAERTGLSPATVHRIWSASGIQPQRGNTFPFSSDPRFVRTVADVVGLYLDPPNRALVLLVDEKRDSRERDRLEAAVVTHSEPRLHDAAAPSATMLFAALDAATAKVPGACPRKSRTTVFRNFLRRIDDVVPDDQEIHLILESSAWQQSPIVVRWLVRHPHFHLHFAPNHSAWLNELVRWFELLSRVEPGRAHRRGVAALERAIRAFTAARAEEPRPFGWTTSADEVHDADELERLFLESSAHNPDGHRLPHGELERAEESRG
jgi:transposase